MLIVLASAHDAPARAIAEAWAPWGGALCTPADLSIPGWRFRVGAPAESAAVVSGRVVPVAAIAGVLTRLSAISPEDLPHIAASDRDYVAAEMTAFLIAFLSALPCKALNRPSAGALSGPAWRPEQWIRLAARAGIPVVARHRRVGRDMAPAVEPETATEAMLIGDRVFGAQAPLLADWARALAREAGVDLLRLGFARQGGGYALAGVNPWPDLASPQASEAARDFLLGGGGRAS
jgi:hypothetical protein